ncbi:Predicted transcriptional regulators [Pasteurella testudinis DSM 23072]|uniref:Predicted transcriptional regulators n=1 Tax=Pasteurella testudinis DSM 23072 TaxID=1122938 RepID=A0A1W1UKE0_9PAST|nr:helix-turn-helix transcriptional regulator [Pasteurella testudinis]SMB81483.1 Predicted transcriptional regulators [Pasteurella testudinis DSM 23072]SUB51427.1 Uncharacterised protein [Pasteurella testudinis]
MRKKTPFGAEMAAIRARLGVAQKQMAEDMGYSGAFLSAIETGTKYAPPDFGFNLHRWLKAHGQNTAVVQMLPQKTNDALRVNWLLKNATITHNGQRLTTVEQVDSIIHKGGEL